MLGELRLVKIDIPATIAAIALLATAIGAPALWQSRRRNKRAEIELARIIEGIQPSNGNDATLADEINARFDKVDAAFVAIDGRFHDQSKRLDGIDRDMSVVKALIESREKEE